MSWLKSLYIYFYLSKTNLKKKHLEPNKQIQMVHSPSLCIWCAPLITFIMTGFASGNKIVQSLYCSPNYRGDAMATYLSWSQLCNQYIIMNWSDILWTILKKNK